MCVCVCTWFSLVPDEGSIGLQNFFIEPMAAGKAGAEEMAATRFILKIHDSISSSLLHPHTHTHTHTQTHRHTHTYRDTHTGTHTHTHSDTQTQTHTSLSLSLSPHVDKPLNNPITMTPQQHP